ncbi:prepilin-type N-terminal cleavage/methylation domain-containing protein [candidate division KSB1 bacterium]|nr:prepilin-type N-terminal cleavage/methylation domain-containing protein [candidate division KSB1 bacterium]
MDKNVIIKKEDGFSLVEIVIILIIVGILASVAFAQFISFSEASKTATCRANQISIETAQTLFYTEHYIAGDGRYASDMDELEPYFRGSRRPVCPIVGGEYQILNAGRATCSIAEHQRN